MKTKVLTVFLSLAAAGLASIYGQDEEVKPPTEPFIKRVSVPGCWTITFTRPAEDEMVDMDAVRKLMTQMAGPPSGNLVPGKAAEVPLPNPSAAAPSASPVGIMKRMVRTLTVTRSTDFAKEAATFSDKTSQTSYIFNVARVTKHVSYNGLIRSRTEADVASYSPNYENADFTGFDWLSAKNYKGVQDVQGRKCYVFEDERVVQISKLMPMPATDAKITTRALIEVATRLPLALQLGKESRVYAFSAPNPADLALPSEIAAEITSWRAQLFSATKAAPPP